MDPGLKGDTINLMVNLKAEDKKRELEIKNLLKKEFAHFDSYLKGYKVILFGSRAKGSAKARSDFDIGIVGKQSLPHKTFFEIEEAIEALPTLYKIDLVDFSTKNDSFKEEALTVYEELYPL